MASLLETAIESYRQQLLQQDAEVLAQVIEAYQETRATLMERIEALTAAMEDGASVSEVLRSERARALLRQTEAEMAALGVKARSPIVNGQRMAANMAVDHALGMAVAQVSGGAVARIESSWNRLNAPAVEAMVGRLSDGSPLNEWIAQFGDDAAATMRRELTTAAALGTNPRATAARLAKSVDVSGARLLMLTRTAQLDAYRDASRSTYIANQDILSGTMRISSLSDRTCVSCLALHKSVHPVDYRLEEHVAGRCTLIPLVDGVEPPDVQDGEAWLQAQPAETQRQVLGVAGQDAYARGEVGLIDFAERVEDKRWGSSYRQASLTTARANATKRGGGDIRIDASSVVSDRIEPFASLNDAEAWGERYVDWSKSLTDSERAALTEYKGNAFKDINPALRKGKIADKGKFQGVPTEALREQVAIIDGAIAKGSNDRGIVVYRGTTIEWMGDVERLVGTEFEDQGFVSTSFNRKVADRFVRFTGGRQPVAVMEISVPKGNRIAYLDKVKSPDALAYEYEMLLPRGTRFRVTEVLTDEQGQTVIRVEVVE